MGSLFGKKPKKQKGPQGAAKALEGLDTEVETPMTARDTRMGVRSSRAVRENQAR